MSATSQDARRGQPDRATLTAEQTLQETTMTIQTTFAGNLVEDPTYRITPHGNAVTNLRVAVNHRTRDSSGTWQDTEATYLTVTAWRRLVENVAESLHKGDQVLITGRLHQRHHQTAAGEQRISYEVVADMIGAGLAHVTATLTPNQRPDHTPAGS